MKNLEKIASDLFSKIRGRFPNVTIGDTDGNITNVPSDARYYDFSYVNEGEDLGKVSVSLDEETGIVVIVGKDLVQGQVESVQDKWYNFLKELRMFAKKRLLSFDVRDINKTNLTKRDYNFLATNRSGEDTMSESKMYGTSKTSYQRIGNARLAIKHSQPINTESVTGRTQKIHAIYVESPEGERFRFPFKHLSGARAMARHVSEGGNAYDDFGKYISGLSEEVAKLRKFNQYISRSAVMAETLGGYTDIVKTRVSEVKKEIQNLQKESFYKEAISNFVAQVVEEVPEDVAENWIDQLTIKQFNEELKDVFPFIYKLVGEATKAKTLSFEDLVAEADDPCWKGYKQIGMKKKGGKQVPNCVPEETALESGFDAMMGQFADNETDFAPGADANNSPLSMPPEDLEEPKTPIGEFILSYFDRETGKFPKGETAVLTAVQKEYGDNFIKPAAQFVKKVESLTMAKKAEEIQQSAHPETAMIKQLAGV